jgi:hypothetical protein
MNAADSIAAHRHSLYGKVIGELAARRLRGVAFDLPDSGSRNGARTSTTRGAGLGASPSRR